jgi:hypothetical protein
VSAEKTYRVVFDTCSLQLSADPSLERTIKEAQELREELDAIEALREAIDETAAEDPVSYTTS